MEIRRLKKITNARVREMLEQGPLPGPRQVPEDLDREIKRGIYNMAAADTDSPRRRTRLLTASRLILGFASLGAAAAAVFLVIHFSGGPVAGTVSTAPPSRPRVSFLAGTASVTTTPAEGWRPLTPGETLGANAVLRAGTDARITLEYPGRVSLSMGGGTTVALGARLAGHPAVKMEDGLIHVDETGGPEFSLRVIADHLVFSALGTRYSVVHDPREKTSTLRVTAGSVAAQRYIPDTAFANQIRNEAGWLYPALEAFLNQTLITDAGREVTLRHDHIEAAILQVRQTSQKVLDAARTGVRLSPAEKQRIMESVKALIPVTAAPFGRNNPPLDKNERPSSAPAHNGKTAPSATRKGETPPAPASIEETQPASREEEKPYSYATDFESAAALPFVTTDWAVKADDDGNHVFAPVPAPGGNADAHYMLPFPGDFRMNFRFKRIPGKEGTCWMVVDLGLPGRSNADNEWIIVENKKIVLGNRKDERVYRTANVNVKPGVWHELSLKVTAGDTVSITLDQVPVLSYRLEQKKEYAYLKIEGDPMIGTWYLDDFSVTELKQ